MPSIRSMITMAIVVIVVLAIVNRVGFLKKITG